jgi:hypothetical protein
MKDENAYAISYHLIANTTFSFVSTQKLYFSTYMQLYLVEKELRPWILPAISGMYHRYYDLQ